MRVAEVSPALLARWRWRAARQPALLFWAAFLLWETLALRCAALTAPNAVGLADELSLVLLGLFVGALLQAWPGWARALALGLVGACLAAFNLANALFFRFFETFLSAGSYSAIGQVPGAEISIKALLGPRMIALAVAAPLGLLLAALFFSRGRARRVPSWAGAWALGGALLVGLHAAGAHKMFLAAESDPFLHVLRQTAQNAYHARTANRAARLRELAASMPRQLGPVDPGRYKLGGHPEYPLYRDPVKPAAPAKKLNVVLVLMESFRLADTGIGTGHAEIAPVLDSLAQQGVYVPSFYANAHQTVRGEAATLCSVLPNYGSGQIYTVYPNLNATCLPELLEEQGYETHWVSAYDSSFGNKRPFLTSHGVARIHDERALQGRKLEHKQLGWGAADEDTVGMLLDVLDQAKPPFFAEWMTLSNHHPFTWDYDVPAPAWIDKLPEKEEYRGYLKGMHYTDYAIGKFLAQARTKPWFKDTLFVFLGDHGAWLFAEHGGHPPTPAQRLEMYSRTPFIMWSPANLQPRRLDVVGSQIDVAPTLLDVLGFDVPNAMEGVSLLSQSRTPPRFAMLGNENSWSIRQGDEYCYAMGQRCFLSMAPYCPKGYEPQPAGHGCFTFHGDLLDTGAQGTALHMLTDAEGASLLERGQQLVDGNRDLLMLDAFFPRARH